MSEQVTVDSLEFARSGKTLSGNFQLASLARLHDQLASLDATLAYELNGCLDEKGQPGLHCRVRGTLKLTCQRCLEPMDWEVVLDSQLLLVTTEAQLGEDEDELDGPDRLLAQKEMDVRALVEEEVLLGLPLAPRHGEGRCRMAVTQAGTASHPLAVLAQLARPDTDKRDRE
ncbi:YceD family protein [Thiobacter aerophilum]|uniref:Large ribosomal RNA subunit accumulation protein YceD n=1 Tax=Thiobacter aerophilum TaxID=3121275 RepID=A0ABV0EAG1_9BURK